MADFQHALVTGASSGIGAGLAVRLARPGVRLTLVARRAERLAAVREACAALGAETTIAVGDVTDGPSLEALVGAADDAAPIDMLIANAGIGGSSGRQETAEAARAIFDTNLAGVINTVAPLLPRMAARKRGRVGLIASLAGLVALPSAPAYCASKAAVIAWGDAQRQLYARTGVTISIVCPGFVETDMIAGLPFRPPFVWSVARCADRIVRGIEAGQARVAFPWQLVAAIRLGRALPRGLQDRAMRPR